MTPQDLHERVYHPGHVAPSRALPAMGELGFLKHFLHDETAHRPPQKGVICHRCISHPLSEVTRVCSTDAPVTQHLVRTTLALFVLDVGLVGFDLSLLMAVLH